MPKKQDSQPPAEDFEFEKAYARLEEIVDKLDEGKLPLDQLLAHFEEGIQLAKACGKRLDDVERRVQILLEDEDGNAVLEDFDAEEETD